MDCISYLFEQAAARSSSLFGKWITRMELPRTRRYEGRLVNQFDRVLVTSAVDKAAFERVAAQHSPLSPLRKGCRRDEVVVLPNGVDLAYFTPSGEPREPDTLVFSGKMSYHANVTGALHLVHDIMPLVWQERPEVKVVIAGKDPPREVQRLAADRGARVTVTGTVPDMRPCGGPRWLPHLCPMARASRTKCSKQWPAPRRSSPAGRRWPRCRRQMESTYSSPRMPGASPAISCASSTILSWAGVWVRPAGATWNNTMTGI